MNLLLWRRHDGPPNPRDQWLAWTLIVTALLNDLMDGDGIGLFNVLVVLGVIAAEVWRRWICPPS